MFPDAAISGGNAWGCVGQVNLDEMSSAPIPIDLVVYDVATRLPPPGLLVVACWTPSPDCADFAAGPVGAMDGGDVPLSLPANFIGTLTITANGMIPSLIQLTRRVGKMTLPPNPIELVSLQTATFEAEALGTAIDPTRGLLLLQALDCSGNKASGVSFELETPAFGAEPFYFRGLYPVTTGDGTDASGGGGILNVPVGNQMVREIRVADGEIINSFPAVIQAGWVTYATVEPSGTLNPDPAQ